MTVVTKEREYAAKLKEIIGVIKHHRGPIFVASHVDPDGDAIGSVLGLSRGLTKLGFVARAVANAPRYLNFLPIEGELLPAQDQLPDNTLLLALDCGDESRIEGVPVKQAGVNIINIDHHGSNPRYGTVSLVEPDKAATAMIIKNLLDAFGLVWDAHVATPLLTGIVTDTGSFRYSNTNPEVLHMAAELISYGAPLNQINEFIATQPRPFFRLQAEVFNTIEYPLEGLVVMAHVNQAMLERVGASWEEVESLVSLIRTAEGTQLAVLLKDFGDRTKVSLRSRGAVSAQNIALALGGGGHVAAAGANLGLPFPEARIRVLEASLAEFQRVGLL